jgi:hypothetical protein
MKENKRSKRELQFLLIRVQKYELWLADIL